MPAFPFPSQAAQPQSISSLSFLTVYRQRLFQEKPLSSPKAPLGAFRCTKIIATMGPATHSEQRLTELFDAGVNVFRMNASHGSWKERLERITRVRRMAERRDAHVGILLDLQGPKIRLGRFKDGGCMLEAGAEFTITVDEVLGTAERACTTYASFAQDVKPGDRVLLADGAVVLQAVEAKGNDVRCLVVIGGEISDHKGINLPGAKLRTPALTKKDLEDLEFGLEARVDFVALSFVRTGIDVRQLKQILVTRGYEIPVIAKIEKPEALENLDAILEETDGVMVARGDLGVEMSLERVPFIQKQLIAKARNCGKFVITATQMLESMIDHLHPTRAEVSDIANAICDGTDSLMLSAETSVGIDPGRVVRTMAKVAEETEHWSRSNITPTIPHPTTPTNAEIIADAAYHAASAAGVTAIGIYTRSGLGARLISHYRPPVPIYAFTPNAEVARRLSVWYGVLPILSPTLDTTDQKIAHMEEQLLERQLLEPEDNVVFVAGQPRGQVSGIDLIKLHRLESR